MAECLVVARVELEKMSFWKSLHRNGGVIEDAIPLLLPQRQEFEDVVKNHQVFLERKGETGVETKPEWQQVIMYAVVTKDKKMFVYQRGGTNSTNGEQRLSLKTSIGIGGHIEPFDQGLNSALLREIDEEIVLEDSLGNEVGLENVPVSVIGLVKYDGTEVDSVHVGMVCRVDLTGLDVEPKIRGEGGENISGEMVSLIEYRQKVKDGLLNPEHWTRLIVDRMGDQIIGQ